MDIFSLLRLAKANGASDLNLIESIPPLLRVNGPLEVLNGAAPLTAGEINQAFLQISTPEEREHFHRYLELDFACSLPDVGRLRCNAAQQRGAISLALRLLPAEIPTIDGLELPEICKELVLKPRGLVIVTGPTGSGKTTTLTTMVHYLNANETRHIVTVEDPSVAYSCQPRCNLTGSHWNHSGW